MDVDGGGVGVSVGTGMGVDVGGSAGVSVGEEGGLVRESKVGGDEVAGGEGPHVDSNNPTSKPINSSLLLLITITSL